MTRWRLAALVGALLLVAGCGGGPAAGAGHQQASRSARPNPLPRERVGWRVGETFTGALTFDQRDRGALDDELRFSAHERLRVLKVEAGVATIRAAVMNWHWQRNTSAVLTTSVPGPATFAVDSEGRIVSGLDWPLPSQLPLPGLDVFAAPPLASSAGWSRTDSEGVDLAYQARAGSPPGESVLDWSTVRPRFTSSGALITVSGRAAVTVWSHYKRRGATVFPRWTRERGTFVTSTRAGAGTTQEAGTILETTIFSAPLR